MEGGRTRSKMQQQRQGSAARTGRKRQREEAPHCRPAQQQQQHQLFLPTHLSLLRALHADDATALGKNSADSSCPRPSWVEIHSFLELQASMVNRDSEAQRTKAVLHILSPAGTHQRQQRQESGVHQSQPVDPRSVVSAVLRNAVRNREAEQVSASAGLRGLRKAVDDTVEHLSASLDGLRRSKRDRARPWSNSQQDNVQAAHVADVLERHHSKLLLWRRLQGALAAARVVVD